MKPSIKYIKYSLFIIYTEKMIGKADNNKYKHKYSHFLASISNIDNATANNSNSRVTAKFAYLY